MCAMDYMPFVHQVESRDYKVDIKSVTQALIIAAVTGLIVMYGTQKSIMVELSAIKEDVNEVQLHQKQFIRDFYKPKI